MSSRSGRAVGSLVIAAACFGLLLATSTMLPMVWDEGNAIHRAQRIRHWFGRFQESLTEPFSRRAIDDDWPCTTKVEGHPAFNGIVIAVGQAAGEPWLAPLNTARLGPMALFALAVAAASYRLWRIASPVAALVGAAALVTMPRLFAHAHFASFDGPLTSSWLLAWATFAPALGSWRWSVAWGAALGMTMSCKLTGWLALPPFLFWVAAFGDRRAARALALGVAVAAVTFWMLNPPLWHDPLAGFERFLDLNLGRAENPGLNIPTTYFGATYNAQRPLPWHNTLVWTAITVPVGTLALFLVGLVRTLRSWRARAEWLLVPLNFAILVVVRATPWAPPHDAERLFLPSFAFLALLAGLGGETLWSWSSAAATFRGRWLEAGRKATADLRHGVPQLREAPPPSNGRGRQHGAQRWLARGAVVAALAGSAASTAWYAPQWLCYYNLLAGGLRGAEALGMEATYYWDGLDAEVLTWLHEHTAENEKIAFAEAPAENLQLMREWGKLRRGCLAHEPGRYRWYVIQRRPSFWSAADRRLIERARPAFCKTVRAPAAGWGPWRLDVPIVAVYDYAEYERLLR